MSITINSLARYSFGSEYLLQKLINKTYGNEYNSKSTSSILLDVYRELYFSKRLTYDELIEKYSKKNTADVDDDAVVVKDEVDETDNTTNETTSADEFEMDEEIPEDSTVSYHV